MHPTMGVVNLIMVATPTLSTMLESLNHYGCHTLVHHIDYIHRPRPRAFSSRQCSVSKHGCGLTHGFHAPLAKTWAWFNNQNMSVARLIMIATYPLSVIFAVLWLPGSNPFPTDLTFYDCHFHLGPPPLLPSWWSLTIVTVIYISCRKIWSEV